MTQVVVTIELPAGPRGFRELALLLKRLLRSFGMRCISIEPATTEKTIEATK